MVVKDFYLFIFVFLYFNVLICMNLFYIYKNFNKLEHEIDFLKSNCIMWS